MKQQWQQMTEQQKKLAIVLIVVIVLAAVLIAWQLLPRGTSTTTTTEVAQQPVSPMPGAGVPATGMPGTGTGAPGFETAPELASQVGAPATAGPMPSAPGAPGEAAPTTTPPGKLENPPYQGRSDPFSDLPAKKVEPFTPIVLPPTPEPVVIARTQPSSIGTEPFSLSESVTSIPTLQAQSVDLRSYFAPPQPITTGRKELSGWRLAGTILTEGSVGAIIQTPDGRSQAVRLGGRITYGGTDYTVTQVDGEKVILRDSKGEEYTLSRRPATAPTPPGGAYMMPSGFGQFVPGGWGPGGY
ncbi:MAG: hypothetical protein N3B10_00585 [Armatimonadetes bacterium]|nr:hypothetical protein [Armatimonadota bacterium]